MTRERIVGFLLGISVGTFMGFYLRPAQSDREDNARERREAREKQPGAGGSRSIGNQPSVRAGSIASVGGAS